MKLVYKVRRNILDAPWACPSLRCLFWGMGEASKLEAPWVPDDNGLDLLITDMAVRWLYPTFLTNSSIPF